MAAWRTRRSRSIAEQPRDLAAADAQVAQFELAHRAQLALVQPAAAQRANAIEQAGDEGGLARQHEVAP
jgi:hypothetical protein